MTFEAILIVWCAALLIAGAALVSLVVVEIRMIAAWWRKRRARRSTYVLPTALVVDTKKPTRVQRDDPR